MVAASTPLFLHLFQEADEVTNGGRNGGFTSSTAFNGIHSRTYYMTPSAFYGGGGEVSMPFCLLLMWVYYRRIASYFVRVITSFLVPNFITS